MHSPIIVAVDKNNLNEALALADSLDPALCRLKVGKELFTSCGPQIVKDLQKRNFEIFLDLKFHDIPNTTAQAVLAAADLGVWMVNVHASIGAAAMQLCKDRLTQGGYPTLLIAVTVLTSMTDAVLAEIGVRNKADEQVLQLAKIAKSSGIDGVVCSAQEAKMLRQHCGEEFVLVTPGIRLAEDNTDDQKRICTPKQAMDLGANYLVIGRPITQAANPSDKLQQIVQSLDLA